jgi:protein-histidine pros-kinase
VFWNQGAEHVYGWTRQEALGQIVHTLLRTEFPAPLPEIHATFFQEGRWKGELVHHRRDGTRLTVASRWTLQRDSHGNPAAFVEINNDITEQKRIELSLQEKNVELEKANQAKDNFLATMSHELRTPLNAIIGFTGTLLMRLPGPLTADQEKQLRTVQGSARHLLSLINDLLDLAKIESGKVELHPETILCQGVIQDVVMSLKPQAVAKRLELNFRPPPGDLPVRADRRALSQILLNLINNAIKFTEAGSITVDVERKKTDRGTAIEFRVADTGIGIRSEDQVKLFRAFSQVYDTGKRRQEGSGLGLHLSAKLAELMGGQITFQSEHARGSTFTFTLEERDTPCPPASC